MNDTEVDYVKFNLALACRKQALCRLELTALDKQIKAFSRRYDILINQRDKALPRTPEYRETETKQIRTAKEETRTAIIKELSKRGIKEYDVILNYVCFKYKGRECRVNTAFNARQILGLN